MPNALKQIAQHKLIPVVVIDAEEYALPLADALVAGGLPIAEITFRTDAAEGAIRALAKRGDLLVGAGTVLTLEQADRAIDAGAAFVVAPGTNRQVVEHCMERNIPITPGVATPTDIELALSLGLDTLKFFPAQALGGVPMLKAISGPYRQVRFVPTGGITLDNMLDYLAMPHVLACGGSWLAARDKLANNQFDTIQHTVAAAVKRLATHS